MLLLTPVFYFTPGLCHVIVTRISVYCDGSSINFKLSFGYFKLFFPPIMFNCALVIRIYSISYHHTCITGYIQLVTLSFNFQLSLGIIFKVFTVHILSMYWVV